MAHEEFVYKIYFISTGNYHYKVYSRVGDAKRRINRQQASCKRYLNHWPSSEYHQSLNAEWEPAIIHKVKIIEEYVETVG